MAKEFYFCLFCLKAFFLFVQIHLCKSASCCNFLLKVIFYWQSVKNTKPKKKHILSWTLKFNNLIFSLRVWDGTLGFFAISPNNGLFDLGAEFAATSTSGKISSCLDCSPLEQAFSSQQKDELQFVDGNKYFYMVFDNTHIWVLQTIKLPKCQCSVILIRNVSHVWRTPASIIWAAFYKPWHLCSCTHVFW